LPILIGRGSLCLLLHLLLLLLHLLLQSLILQRELLHLYLQ